MTTAHDSEIKAFLNSHTQTPATPGNEAKALVNFYTKLSDISLKLSPDIQTILNIHESHFGTKNAQSYVDTTRKQIQDWISEYGHYATQEINIDLALPHILNSHIRMIRNMFVYRLTECIAGINIFQPIKFIEMPIKGKHEKVEVEYGVYQRLESLYPGSIFAFEMHELDGFNTKVIFLEPAKAYDSWYKNQGFNRLKKLLNSDLLGKKAKETLNRLDYFLVSPSIDRFGRFIRTKNNQLNFLIPTIDEKSINSKGNLKSLWAEQLDSSFFHIYQNEFYGFPNAHCHTLVELYEACNDYEFLARLGNQKDTMNGIKNIVIAHLLRQLYLEKLHFGAIPPEDKIIPNLQAIFANLATPAIKVLQAFKNI